MAESNEQSNLLKDLPPTVAPGEYLLNKAKIAEAKALISAYEEMNEAGKQTHDELAHELEQKIREGEQARYVSALTFQYNTICICTLQRTVVTIKVAVSAHSNCSTSLNSNYLRSTFQVPSIRRPAIDYPSSTSRIEEIPNPGSVSSYRSS
jgi:hypothetical protein